MRTTTRSACDHRSRLKRCELSFRISLARVKRESRFDCLHSPSVRPRERSERVKAVWADERKAPMFSRLKHFISFACFVGAVQLASVANAGSIGNATISKIGITPSGNLAYVFFTSSLTSPACTTGNGVVFDHSTVIGKARFTALTSAYLAGKRVTVQGNSSCTSVSHGFPDQAYSMESISGLYIAN